MKPFVKLTKNRLQEFVDGIKMMESQKVFVGVPGEKTRRGSGDPMNNATLAAIHDNGSPAANVPQREFLRPGVKDAHPQVVKILKTAADPLRVTRQVLATALEQAGLSAQAAVKKRIVSQEGFEPLQDKTIARRKKQGFKGEKALIQSAKLLNSVNYVVREK